ncbi:MAG: hypothetical protein HQK54_14705 [Oligoflexales bacterium]|nr:hypothetical protein [Oligoflexales bacterium]
MYLSICILLATAFFLFAEYLSKRFLFFTLVFYIVLPAALTPLVWVNNGITDWFRWSKVYSVLIGIIIISLMRYTKLGNSSYLRWTMVFALSCNIMEAVIQDFSGSGIYHHLNGTAGLLLIPGYLRISDIRIEKTGGDLKWDSTNLPWIIGYTIWNWTFVVLNYPDYASHHIAVLGSALIIGIFNHKVWLQARTYTLGTFMILYFTGPEKILFLPFFDYTREHLRLGASIISIGYMIAYIIWYFLLRRNRTKTETVIDA